MSPCYREEPGLKTSNVSFRPRRRGQSERKTCTQLIGWRNAVDPEMPRQGKKKTRTKTESSKFMFKSLIKRESKQNSCLWATLPWSHCVSVWPPILSALRLPDESCPGYLAYVTNPFLYCMEHFSELPDPSSGPQLLRPGKPRFLVYEDTKTGLQNSPPKHFAYLK